MKRNINIQFLNKLENYVEYLEKAISFDNENSWLFEADLDDDIIWSLEDKRYTSFSYGLFLGDKFIGLLMINFNDNEDFDLSYEISIIIHPQYRNQGMATFLLQQVIAKLKLNSKLIKSLTAIIYTDNKFSQKLFLNNGFNFQGFKMVNDKLCCSYQCNLVDVIVNKNELMHH